MGQQKSVQSLLSHDRACLLKTSREKTTFHNSKINFRTTIAELKHIPRNIQTARAEQKQLEWRRNVTGKRP